ncbi:MAG: molybdenum cofactor biosynthesis protein MoaE [Verrucomicrobiota bacterium]
MPPSFTHLSITPDPLSPPKLPHNTAWGSQLTFAGIVRGHENGTPIKGINYHVYLSLAKATIDKIAENGRAKFEPHGLWIEHRFNFVPAGEPSLYIAIGTPHSKEGNDILTWYLQTVKSTLPVWKEIVP